MRRAIVLGANGQDGAFLVGHLCRRGYSVLGVGRQENFRAPLPAGDFTYASVDLRDADRLAALLADAAPDVIFHLAAVHGSASTRYETVFRDMQLVNTASLHVALEHARLHNPACGIVYASSMKAFGANPQGVVDESTPRVTACLYSLTKNTSHDLIAYYRQTHGIKASVLLLFNHESELRPAHFFMPRLVACLADALRGGEGGALHTLDFQCDWGCASEFMDMAVDVAERAIGEDFVLASGQTWYARDLVQTLFANHGLDYRRHVREAVAGEAARSQGYRVSLAKLHERLGRQPRRQAVEIAEHMLRFRLGIAA